MDFDEFSKSIASLRTTNDSDYFHRVIEKMLDYLGFAFNDQWFEVSFINGSHNIMVPKLIDLVFNYGKIPAAKKFSRSQKYCKDLSFVVSTTTHTSARNLLANKYEDVTIMSNSTLGLDNKVMDREEAIKVFENPTKDPTLVALGKGYILRSDKSSVPYYFLDADLLFCLCLKKDLFKKKERFA